jgi:hypothetical protein
MDRRSIRDVYLKTEQLQYIHIPTLNLLLKESQQVGRKRNYRDMEISHAQSVRIVEKKRPIIEIFSEFISLPTLVAPEVWPSRPVELHHQPLTGRVENWRAGLGRCLCSQFLALSYASATISLPCHVSNSRHVKRSVRFSRTALSFCLHSKGYDAYRLAALSSLCGLTL